MAGKSSLAPRDRDLDDGVLDLPARDRPALKKLDTRRSTMKTTRKKKTIMYTSKQPTGLWPVGTTVKYLGGAKLRNDWLKKGAVGRIFAYRPGRKQGGLYAVRFDEGSTMLSVKRVERARKGSGQ